MVTLQELHQHQPILPRQIHVQDDGVQGGALAVAHGFSSVLGRDHFEPGLVQTGRSHETPITFVVHEQDSLWHGGIDKGLRLQRK